MCMPAGKMLRSAEGRRPMKFFDEWELDGLGRKIICVFVLGGVIEFREPCRGRGGEQIV